MLNVSKSSLPDRVPLLLVEANIFGVDVGDGAEGLEICCGLGLDDDAGEAEKYDAEEPGVGDELDERGVEGGLTICCDEEPGACIAFGTALAATWVAEAGAGACGTTSNCFTATA